MRPATAKIPLRLMTCQHSRASLRDKMARLLLDLGEDAIRLISEEAGSCAVLHEAPFTEDGRVDGLDAALRGALRASVRR